MTEVKLGDLLDEAVLAQAIEDGFVRRQVHPVLPLMILNYTERCQYEHGAWNDVTRQCRGLIVHADTSAVLARPWPKFFNHGQEEAGVLDLAAPAEVTDKMDGSLAIAYPVLDGWAIATRGSFASDQALHATAVLRSRYPGFRPPEGVTALFEVIYRANRIVCDYGDLDDLVLLGGVDIATGRDVPMDSIGWPGPKTTVFSAATLAAALALPPRDNAEGVVVRLLDTDARVKIKIERYVELHRLITGMNARVVWEKIGEGLTADDLCRDIPEEFWPWVREIAAELAGQRDAILAAAAAEHERLLAVLPHEWTRKDYALEAQKSPHRAWLFNLLDGRDPSPGIWKTLRPSGERTLVAYSEDTA